MLRYGWLQPGLTVEDHGPPSETRRRGKTVLWRIGISALISFSVYGCAFVPYDPQIDQGATDLYKDTYVFLLWIEVRQNGSSKSEYYAHQKFYNDAAARLAALKLRAEIQSTPKEQDLVRAITNLQQAYATLANTDRINGLNSTAIADFQNSIDRDFRALLKKEAFQKALSGG
jgi:hypothetical protein